MPLARLDADAITDWDSFHDACAAAFGFPEVYGRNMDAFIDCLAGLGEGDGMSRFHLKAGKTLTIELRGADAFCERCPQIALALLSCVAFVTARHAGDGKNPMPGLVPV